MKTKEEERDWLDFAWRLRHWPLDSRWVEDGYIRRPLSQRFDTKYVVATMEHPPSQMSCHSAAGLYLIPPNTTMNGHKYV